MKTNYVKSSDITRCPETSLPILQKPEWQDINFGKDYSLTMRIIAEKILWVRPAGYVTLHDVIHLLNFLKTELQKHIGTDQPHVSINDWSSLKGASYKSKKYYIDHLKTNKGLLGLIFYNVSPMQKLSIKLGKRFNSIKLNIQVVKDYKTAVLTAMKMLSKLHPEKETDGSPAPSNALDMHPPGEALKIKSSTDWSMQDKSYSLSFEIINDQVLHGISTGRLEKKHIDKAIALQKKIIHTMNWRSGNYFFVLNLQKSLTISQHTRKHYMRSLLALYQQYPFQMLIFYGVNRRLKAGINLARPFVPFKIRVVDNLKNALAAIAKQRQEIDPAFKHDGRQNRETIPASNIHKKYVDDLLQYIEKINWDDSVTEDSVEIDPNHPFHPVFEAIELIKWELIDLLKERKQAENERVKLESLLQRARKMEAIGMLAGGVAHDLNNVLSSIVGYPELLLMDMPSQNPLHEPLTTVKESGEKAAAIVQDLLTLSRRGVTVTEVMNLNTIVNEYVNGPEFQKIKSHNPLVRVETRLDHNLLNIQGSALHVSKALMDLLSNAVDAMPDGGQAIITTQNSYIDGAMARYEEIKQGNYAMLSISDTGVGISDEDMERIFEPFYTKKVMGRRGTGLGMAVVWGVVKDHSGYIDVQSQKGKGTIIKLYFPVTKEEILDVEPAVPLEAIMGKGETILIVDDVPEQRKIASAMLKKLGYAVSSVSGGEEALEYLGHTAVDLLLLDMIMDPGIDGLQTYEKVIELHPGQKAVIASGFSETERVKAAQKLGAGQYVKKPYTIDAIAMAVRQELDR